MCIKQIRVANWVVTETDIHLWRAQNRQADLYRCLIQFCVWPKKNHFKITRRCIPFDCPEFIVALVASGNAMKKTKARREIKMKCEMLVIEPSDCVYAYFGHENRDSDAEHWHEVHERRMPAVFSNKQ